MHIPINGNLSMWAPCLKLKELVEVCKILHCELILLGVLFLLQFLGHHTEVK